MRSATKPLPRDGKDAQSLEATGRDISNAGEVDQSSRPGPTPPPAFEVRRLTDSPGEVRAKSENINGDQVVLISAFPGPS